MSVHVDMWFESLPDEAYTLLRDTLIGFARGGTVVTGKIEQVDHLPETETGENDGSSH
jgi:hypothetical protein